MMNHANTMTPMAKWDSPSRDAMCLAFAIVLHSTLLLWKGGLLTLPESGQGLGDMLVSVDFRSNVPDFQEAGGGSSPKPTNIFARMKSFMKGDGLAGKKTSEIAMGNTEPVKVEKPAWTKTDVLSDKTFAEKKGFQGVAQKDALQIATGKTQEVLVRPSDGNFKEAQPNLKENKFKLAQKDVPFKIVTSKQTDQLANVNAVPVNMGATTSANVKSLDGGAGSGPALQSKTFASKGASSNGGFGGLPSGTKSGSGGGLAMGGSAGAGVAGGMSAGGGAGASGYSSGQGTGQGSGTGSGVGSGSGHGGRSWGGSGGTGFGSGTSMQTLARNTVSDVSSGSKSAYNSGFNITGALANRPIAQKVLAKYEIDGRVSLRFRVDWSGKVMDGILVEQSSGSPTFDQKVVASLKQWLFSRLPADRTNEVQEGVITFVFKGV